MSLMSDYWREREGRQTFEDDDGFVTFCYPSAEICYLVDIYVVPGMRKRGKATYYADLIAAEAKRCGRTRLLGSVDSRLPSATDSIRVLLAYGMRLDRIANELIYFIKDL